MARLSIMDRLLIALGPPFSEKLPKAPTNDTLATVPTPINITAEPCPYKYKVRCCVFFCSKGQYNFPYPVFLRNLFVFFCYLKLYSTPLLTINSLRKPSCAIFISVDRLINLIPVPRPDGPVTLSCPAEMLLADVLPFMRHPPQHRPRRVAAEVQPVLQPLHRLRQQTGRDQRHAPPLQEQHRSLQLPPDPPDQGLRLHTQPHAQTRSVQMHSTPRSWNK